MNKHLTNREDQLRVVLLYRASSKKQTDSENDIPLQRSILRPWADKQGKFICEFVEGGVSGFKMSASKRDAIVEIKAMADRGEFDILGIYMSDRLGRIADETPLIVSYLNARGVRIISFREGEISSKTHADKLLTYIRYWQAEAESLKTSARVIDAGEHNVQQGKWRGGKPPYGYYSVSRGTLNFKGKPIFDVEINPKQAEVVKLVFRMFTKEHYGTRTIANYLNNKEFFPANGCLWDGSRIRKMLTNKLYAGVYELGRVKKNRSLLASPIMEKLLIISMDDFDKAQELLRKTQNKSGVRPTRRGSLMLTGLLFCECGRKFTSVHFNTKRQRKDGTIWLYERSAYRCTSSVNPKYGQPNCKQKLFTAHILENLIIDDIKKISSDDKFKILNKQSQMDKKAMLIELIDRITVYDEKIEIEYKMKAENLTDQENLGYDKVSYEGETTLVCKNRQNPTATG